MSDERAPYDEEPRASTGRLDFATPQRQAAPQARWGARVAGTLLMIRIGWGYDIHRLYPGRPTVLGGVPFPDFPHGFDTHSDGDVVADAIIDALAGPSRSARLATTSPRTILRTKTRAALGSRASAR